MCWQSGSLAAVPHGSVHVAPVPEVRTRRHGAFVRVGFDVDEASFPGMSAPAHLPLSQCIQAPVGWFPPRPHLAEETTMDLGRPVRLASIKEFFLSQRFRKLIRASYRGLGDLPIFRREVMASRLLAPSRSRQVGRAGGWSRVLGLTG